MLESEHSPVDSFVPKTKNHEEDITDQSLLETELDRRTVLRLGAGAVIAGIEQTKIGPFGRIKSFFKANSTAPETELPSELKTSVPQENTSRPVEPAETTPTADAHLARMLEINTTPPVRDYDLIRDEWLNEPNDEYDELQRRLALEPDVEVEALHRVVLSKLGFNARGGEHADTLVEDAKILRAKSMVITGTNDELLEKVSTDKDFVDRKGKRIPIISRFRAPQDSYDLRKYESELLHTIKIHKQHLAHEKSLEDLKHDQNLVIELVNEPNLYQATANISEVVDGFVHGAVIARANGFKVLVPPMAPNTPYDSEKFPNGDEMEYYNKFLNELRAHPEFESIKDCLELSVHAYVTKENENPFPRVREIYEQVQKELGLDLPIHITEFGISRDFLESHDDVAGALEVFRLVNLPIPTNLDMIKTINFWTMEATPPSTTTDENGEVLEDYSKQALRNNEESINIKYRALLYAFVNRLQDIHEIQRDKVVREFTDN